MQEYKQFLAEQILTEDKVVTYRYLSRALKVHVNSAKQMLYEFHRSQNARKPDSIHATYLVYGSKKADDPKQHAQGDGDIEMSSSMPEFESAAEQVPTVILSLVQEEQLKHVLLQYEEVTSIHVYSVGPHPMKDLQMLADTARQVIDISASDGLAESSKVFGTIANSHVRRRERRGPITKPAATSATIVAKKPDSKPVSAKQEAKETKAPAAKESTSSVAKKPVPSLKRGGSSGIMQAFAKGASSKPKKKEEEPKAALSDDGEDDSEMMPQPSAAASGRKSRKEREAELRRMMDEDDEEEGEEKADTPMEEDEEPVEEPPAPEPVKEEPAEVVSTSAGDGRRRGKRRVMKKKQILDEQGYLVTIQEQGWESFSEDEPAPVPKQKPVSSAPPSQPSQPSQTSQTSQSAKSKKSGPKGNQGNIMSFFSKK